MHNTKNVYRKGIVFQVPRSNMSTRRYSVHPDGTGSGWTLAEAVDVDQAVGLAYRHANHIAIGVRKRLAHEHTTFADATVGGVHKPGGCRILAIVDQTIDLSIGDASMDLTDNKLRGRGLIYDQTNNAFWCFTNTDGTASTPSAYLLRQHPDRAWNGGDVTWAGAHEFDASVDFTGVVNFDGSINFTGPLIAEGTSNFNGAVDISAVTSTGTTIGFLKYSGSTVFNTTMGGASTWQTLNLSGVVGARRALVTLKVNASINAGYAVGVDESGAIQYHTGYVGPNNANIANTNDAAYFTVMTSATGTIVHGATGGTITVVLLGYVT